MKKYNYIGLFLLGAVVSFSSCKKSLDLKPTDSFTESNAFRTTTDLQQATNTAYDRFGAYANNLYTSALVTDEARLGADNSGQGALTYRYQYSSDPTTGGDVTAAWGAYYSCIDQTNRVLTAIPNVTGNQAIKDGLKGQLLALRAISHFELLRLYGKSYNATDPLGVPYLTTSNVLGQPARNTVAETVTNIEKDLSDAYALMPAVAVSTFSDTLMNKVNVDGYRARIALYKGEYQKAIDYATTVINSAVKPISSGAAFQGIWTDANSEETLLRIRYGTNSSIGSLWTTTAGLVYISPSTGLVASYATGDIRKSTYIGTNSTGANYVKKYYSSSRGGRVVDLKVMRISEMYLLRAEAYAKLAAPNILLAGQDINFVRANRITGYTNEVFTTAPSIIDAVLQERFKELAFEGQRLFDLKRNNLAVNRSATDATPAYINLPAGNYRFVLPIPASEILANPSIIQNAGYNN